MKKNEQPVEVNVDFAVDCVTLWRALVEPEQMRQWFFDNIPDFRPEEGFSVEFMVDTGERKFLHQWQVTEVIAEQLIAYRWRYEGYAGAAQSVFRLTPTANGCHLQINFPVEEDFPDSVPEFTRESCQGGWDYFMGQLGEYLDKP